MGKVQIPNFERNLDWNLLKVFHEIVRSGGVSKAAERLARQQPSVSSALLRLEDCVGSVLCRRGPRGFELTDEGETLAAIARRVFDAVEEIPGRLEDVNCEPEGEIRICMVENLVDPVLDMTIARYSRLYRQVRITIKLAFLPEVHGLVASNKAEIGIAPFLGRRDDELRYDFLYREQHRPFCGRTHRLYGTMVADPDALADEAFVLPDFEEAEAITRYRERHGWGRRSCGQSPHLAEVRRLVMLGLGVGLMPEEMLQADIERGHLWPLMAPQREAQADVLLASNPRAPRSLATRRFLAVLEETRRLAA